MASEYRVCITREDGRQVRLKPGGFGERQLVADIIRRIPYSGVLRTHAQVIATVEDAINDALHSLKEEVDPIA
jgi:hypothetical protein